LSFCGLTVSDVTNACSYSICALNKLAVTLSILLDNIVVLFSPSSVHFTSRKKISTKFHPSSFRVKKVEFLLCCVSTFSVKIVHKLQINVLIYDAISDNKSNFSNLEFDFGGQHCRSTVGSKVYLR